MATYSTGGNYSTGASSASGLAFKPDGTKLFVATLASELLQYELSTAWDITSANNEQSFTTNIPIDTAGIALKGDGTKLFVGDNSSPEIYSYDLSTAWDITSAGNRQSYTLPAFSDSNVTVGDLDVTNSGQSLYVTADDGSRDVWEYKLSTPWDISTISEVDSLYADGGQQSVRGLFVRSNDSQIFVTDDQNDDVLQWEETTFDGTIYASVQK